MSAPLTGTLFDYTARVMSLLGPIESPQIDLVIDQLLRLDTDGTDEITVYVSCRGGHMIDGLKLVDTLAILRSKVRVIAFGLVEGAAILLLVSAHQRLLFPSTLVSTAGIWELPQMHHQIRSRVGLNEPPSPADHLKSMVESRFQEACKPLQQLADPDKLHRILSAQDCIQLGLADAIVTERLSLDSKIERPKHRGR